MAANTHGALKKIQVKGRPFSVGGENAGSRDMGGRENEIAKNGDGTTRVLQKEVPWELADVEIATDVAGHAFIQDIADQGEEVPILWTLANNEMVGAVGIPVGKISFDQMTGLLKCTFQGRGKAKAV